jgi:hypothetical protein
MDTGSGDGAGCVGAEDTDPGVDAASRLTRFSAPEWSAHINGGGKKLSIWLVFQSILLSPWDGSATFDEGLENGNTDSSKITSRDR